MYSGGRDPFEQTQIEGRLQTSFASLQMTYLRENSTDRKGMAGLACHRLVTKK